MKTGLNTAIRQGLLVLACTALLGSAPAQAAADDYYLEYEAKTRFYYNPFTLPALSLSATGLAATSKSQEKGLFLFAMETPADPDGRGAYGFTLAASTVLGSAASIEPSLSYKRRLFFAALPQFAAYSKVELGPSQVFFVAADKGGLVASYGLKGRLGIGAEFYFNEWWGVVAGFDRLTRLQFHKNPDASKPRTLATSELVLGLSTTF